MTRDEIDLAETQVMLATTKAQLAMLPKAVALVLTLKEDMPPATLGIVVAGVRGVAATLRQTADELEAAVKGLAS